MTDTHDSPRLRAPGDARGSSPPPSGTGETPSSSADDVLRSRAAAEPPADSASGSTASRDLDSSGRASGGAPGGRASGPPSSSGSASAPTLHHPTATERASTHLRETGALIQEGGTAIDQAVDSAVVAVSHNRGALPLMQLVDRTVITPFTAVMQGPPPEAGTFGVVRYAIDSIAGVAGVVMGAVSLPGQLVDTMVASLTSVIPPGFGFPAANAFTTMHMGLPHSHVPPPAPPVILPSAGRVSGPGCLTVLINSGPALRASDIGFAPTCGSAGVLEIITGSSSVFINGKRAARAMDMTRVCNPLGVFSAMAAMSQAMSGLDLVMAALPVVQGIAGAAAEYETMTSSEGAEAEAAAGAAVGQAMNAALMAAQAVADASTNALRATVGVPPAILPPAPIVLGMLMPVPIGRPVLIGGLPVPPLGDMLNHGISQRRQHLRERRRPTHLDGDGPPHLHPHGGDDADARPRPHPDDDGNQGRCHAGEPVDVVSGAVLDQKLEFVSPIGLFRWERFYNSALSTADGPIGRGFRHGYQISLKVCLHRCTLVDELGGQVVFPRFDPGESRVFALGWVLERLPELRYRLSRVDRPTFTFAASPNTRTARLVRVEEGLVALTLEYDSARRLVRVHETSATQKELYQLIHDREGRITALLGSDHRPLVEYFYDRRGCLTSCRRQEGGSWRFEYDLDLRVAAAHDPLGHVFKWRYDEHGRCVWTAGERGLLECHFEYGPRSTSVRTGDGGVWTYHFRHDGILTKRVDPYGGCLERLVDEVGRVREEKDAAGRVTRYIYDPVGALVARLAPTGELRPPRRLEAHPDPDAAPGIAAEDRGWRLGSHLPRAARPLDAPRSIASRLGWLFQVPRPPESARVKYDPLGNIVELDGNGRKRAYRRDGRGELIEYVDGDGSSWTYTPGRWLLVVREKDPLGNTVHYGHDTEGRISTVVDPLGARSEFEHDLKGRLVRIRRHGSNHVEYSYGSEEDLQETRDGAGHWLLRLQRDASGNPTRRQLASGESIVTEYDDMSRPALTTVEHDGERSTATFAYGPGGIRTADVRDGLGVLRQLEGKTQRDQVLGRFATTRIHSDELVIHEPTGRRTTVVAHPDGFVEHRRSNGTFELHQYDAFGRLVARATHRRASDGAEVLWGNRYDRSAEGDITRIVDTLRGETRFELDPAHRVVAQADAAGRVEIEHDAAGNVLSKRGLTRLELIEGNRVSESAEESFVLDDRQRLAARKRRSDGQFTRYHYNSLGQLVRVEWRDGEGRSARPDWTARYDGLGRRVSFGAAGQQTELWWDGLRVSAERSPLGEIRVYHYLAPDSLIAYAFTDYPSLDTDPAAGRTYQVYTDPSGLPLCIEDEGGQIVWWATRVDLFGEIEVHPGATVEYQLRWPGHRFDPELGLHYNLHRDYDPRLARYLQPDPIGQAGGINVYAYASNPLRDVDVLGLELCPAARARHADERAAVEAALRPQNSEGRPRAIVPEAEARRIRDALAAAHAREEAEAGRPRPRERSIEAARRASREVVERAASARERADVRDRADVDAANAGRHAGTRDPQGRTYEELGPDGRAARNRAHEAYINGDTDRPGLPVINGTRARCPHVHNMNWDPATQTVHLPPGSAARADADANGFPSSVHYDEAGNPDFSTFNHTDLTGPVDVPAGTYGTNRKRNMNAMRDAAREQMLARGVAEDQVAAWPRTPNSEGNAPTGWTWHEERSPFLGRGRLIPTSVHEAARHTGGVSEAGGAGGDD